MMLVDSHCHLDQLDLTAYDGSLTAALQAARTHDVGCMLCVCIDLEHFPAVVRVAEQHADVFASVGVHPTEVLAAEPLAEELIALAQHPRVIAIGETGLDYYRTTTTPQVQQARFRQHIQAALATGKPLIVHTRQAQTDTISLLQSEEAARVGGVLHCFTETWEMAQRALALNFYISFSGIVTFPKATALREVAQQVPLERLLIETDAPYLAPVPYRGKPNQPAYVKYVAETIAQLRGISYAEVAEQSSRNFFRLFKHAQLASHVN